MPAMSLQSPAKSPSTIRCRWGYVWLPMGNPSGLARRLNPAEDSSPTAAALDAVFRKKSLLEITGIHDSLMLLNRSEARQGSTLESDLNKVCTFRASGHKRQETFTPEGRPGSVGASP